MNGMKAIKTEFLLEFSWKLSWKKIFFYEFFFIGLFYSKKIIDFYGEEIIFLGILVLKKKWKR
jgi:hypothetical protein